MRVVSMVPSWTETLIACGIKPVGRTRFCIHPRQIAAEIPIIGGTKDWDLEQLKKLSPDLVIFDKEENTKQMFQQWDGSSVVTHVKSVKDLAESFMLLSKQLQNSHLALLHEKMNNVLDLLERRSKPIIFKPLKVFGGATLDPAKDCVYIIWKGPWMAINGGTYIASVLECLGWKVRVFDNPSLYPEIEETLLKDANVNTLFSSEPYPFHKKINELEAGGFKGVIVNGEDFSWYGIRGLRFLEAQISSSE